ncbi:hypothetical protein WJX72_003487 [[Myrmecia] bisecta]|uniref:Rhodanese domain-containing protein n=1 Tax=[Myrmecia] bisecta TaxID=41462 RepID=A0AAW1R6K4_9CHLO
MRVTNVGGSLTSALALTLLAWAVRFFRAAAQSKHAAHSSDSNSSKPLGRYFASLSPAALRMLVETDPVPHLVLDVRSEEEVQQSPLPEELQSAVHLPEAELGSALASWPERLSTKPAPTKDVLLVFVADKAEAMQAAAASAAAKRFEHILVLEGGLTAFSKAAHAQVDLNFINRDALAVLLGLAGPLSRRVPVRVLDIRRHDERALYGSIPGTLHVPASQLPSALQMSSDQFQQTYHFPKPSAEDCVVMQCRTNRRAAWAAQLAKDAGLQCCLVYRQGVYGWRLQPAIKAYKSYEKGDPPPEPEAFQMEAINVGAAREELAHLGLASPL